MTASHRTQVGLLLVRELEAQPFRLAWDETS
jgi:hypothetical protein